jgi:hypothetical protein
VFYYCRTYYKAVRVGGGGEWRTCAMRDYEPRPVWMLCALCLLFRRTAVTHRAHKVIQGGDSCPRRVSWLRFPWLAPIRNPFELRGLCCRSYFGPRTCGRSINHCHRSWQGSQSGFPLLTLKCPLLCSAPSTKVLDTVHSWWR